MIDWVRENVSVLTALTSLGTLFIWLAYLHLFYLSFRDQRRPKLLIHEAGGLDVGDRCIVANMSPIAVHVAAVLIDVDHDGERLTFQPKPPKAADAPDADPPGLARQGPLSSGSYLEIGTFDALLTAAGVHERRPSARDGARITVRVVGFIGPELLPTAAERSFEVIDDRDDGTLVHPLSVMPTDLGERQQRRVARTWLEEAQRLDLQRIETPFSVRTDETPTR